MEIGVPQSIFTQKIPHCLQDHKINPIQNRIFMWIKFKVFLDGEKLFTVLCFQAFPFCIFNPIFCDHQDTESELCKIKTSIPRPMSTHKYI